MRGDQPTACSSTSENHPTTKQRQSLSPLDDGDGDADDVGVCDEYECWQTITPRNNDSPCHLFASEPTLLSTGSLCDFLQPSSALSTEMIGKKCPPLCSQQFYRSSKNQDTQIRAVKSVFVQGTCIRFSINPTLHIMHW